jgi:hypothetical protein
VTAAERESRQPAPGFGLLGSSHSLSKAGHDGKAGWVGLAAVLQLRIDLIKQSMGLLESLAVVKHQAIEAFGQGGLAGEAESAAETISHGVVGLEFPGFLEGPRGLEPVP